MSGYYDFGEYSLADFSPVTIEPPVVPLDEMSEPRLRSYLVTLRGQVKLEKAWQDSLGVKDESRLIAIADMYVEAQNYYAQFNPDFHARINGPDYVPVLRLNGKKW